jgi:hypothetical protein
MVATRHDQGDGMEVDRASVRRSRRAPFWALALLWVALAVLTGGLGTLAGDVGDCRDLNIVELEVAGSSDRAEELLEGCADPAADPGTEPTQVQLRGVRDGLNADSWFFVPSYILLIAYWPLVAQLQLGRGPQVARRSRVAVAAVVAAGLLDLLENHALHQVLDDPGEDPWPLVAAAAAVPKFLLIIVASVLGLGALREVWRTRSTNDTGGEAAP